MTVQFYNFSKRRNSTKVVSATGTQYDCKLKEPCSIKSPVLTISGDVFGYDYAYISDFGRYYFVAEITSICKGVTQYTLEEDVLATNKTAIGSTSAQIAFSSTGYDIWKVDTRIAAKVTKTITKDSNTPGNLSGTGCYIISVVNVLSGAATTTYYALDSTNLSTLMTAVCTDSTLQDAIKKYCSDAFDGIVSCIWIPVAQSEVPGTSGQTVKIGNTDISGCTGKLVSSYPMRAASCSVSIPWSYNDFRRNAPYSSVSAWIPGYGYINLNANDLVKETSLKFEFMVDCMTGDCCCQILHAVSNHIFQAVSYNIGVSIPLSRYTMDVGGFVNATTSVIGNATDTVIAGGLLNPAGVVSGAISTLGAGVGLAIAANKRDLSTKGGMGGRAVIAEGIDVEVYVFSVDTEDPDDASYIAAWGRPVGVTHAINNHSGYVQCDAASVSMAGDSYERDAINSFLNGGFFYE